MVCISIIKYINLILLCDFNYLFNLARVGIVKTWIAHDRYLPNTLRMLLTRFLDITTPPTPNLLRYFASIATNPKEQTQLNLLSSVNVLLKFN